MYFNSLNIRWVVFLGVLFFTTYGSVNHISAYLDHLQPVNHFVFSWEHFIPFIPSFIYPYMSIDFFYGLAFFIIAKDQYSKENYKNTINSLGIQLLFNQIFSLICFLSFPLKFSFAKPDIPEQYHFLFNSLLSFDLPYNQTPSLHISILVILTVFYSQHLKNFFLKLFLNIWFILIGFSVLFTYQHHIIDVFMGVFWGLAVILMFNYSPTYQDSFHMNEFSAQTKVFKIYAVSIFIFFILLFLLPILNNFNIIHYHIGAISYIILWFAWVSLLTVFKIMFYGNHFNIRTENHRFTKSFYIIAYFYIRVRALFINYMNTYEKPIDIYPYLSIGSLPTIRKGRYKEDVNIINLAWEGDNKQEQTIGFPLVDLVVPTKEQAITIAQKIHELIESKKHVYVHCALGMFRTIFITGTYLVLYENKKPEETLDFFMSYPIDEHIKQYLNKKRYLFISLFQEIALHKSL